tara:strand:- start:204 stop:608 length:405 start_codon:yes stop_codon:yes gene_type:complete
MKSINKNANAYKTIGEVAKELGLIDKKRGHLQTHTIRYWETQFKQIRPSVRAGKRRYYSLEDLKIITYVKYLLKDKGMTIAGVKKILNDKKNDYVDADTNFGVYNNTLTSTKNIKDKVKKISKIINELKKIKNG